MELDELTTLRSLQERIIQKIQTFETWPDFIAWVKGMTGPIFKAFIIQCLDDIIADGDAKKADLIEVKSSIGQ